LVAAEDGLRAVVCQGYVLSMFEEFLWPGRRLDGQTCHPPRAPLTRRIADTSFGTCSNKSPTRP
jgi:hypothetical protein